MEKCFSHCDAKKSGKLNHKQMVHPLKEAGCLAGPLLKAEAAVMVAQTIGVLRRCTHRGAHSVCNFSQLFSASKTRCFNLRVLQQIIRWRPHVHLYLCAFVARDYC